MAEFKNEASRPPPTSLGSDLEDQAEPRITSVLGATRSSAGPATERGTSEHTRERSHSNVNFVPSNPPRKGISWRTLVVFIRNLIYLGKVKIRTEARNGEYYQGQVARPA